MSNQDQSPAAEGPSNPVLDQPPEYKWKAYVLDLETSEVKAVVAQSTQPNHTEDKPVEAQSIKLEPTEVLLWCPQTEGFGSHKTGTLGRKGGIDGEELQDFAAFQIWLKKLRLNLDLQRTDASHEHHARPYSLKSIHVKSVTRAPNGKLIFIKMAAWVQRDPLNAQEIEVYNENASVGKMEYTNTLFETVFLRGDSVAILMIIRPKPDPKAPKSDLEAPKQDDRLVILTEQVRVPAGSLRFLEIPAGMVDKSKDFAGTAAKEIKEETGLTITESELINLSDLAGQELLRTEVPQTKESLKPAMFPSPGGCDEAITLFAWEKEMDDEEIEALKGKLTGLRKEGENITLRLVRYVDLWKVGSHDGKTLGALALYQGLTDVNQPSKLFLREREKVRAKRAEAAQAN